MMLEVFARNTNNHIVVLKGERESFRSRQRSKTMDGLKVKPMRFVSYKEALKLSRKGRMFGPFEFNTRSKL